ncbi:hypothetical protein QFC20_007502 [Naganishia adeliensis]|uniref:Uncharacterized protein n=1 Tax=Naganishia adeliensis TaxID=92952 RepID=A0ACC2UZ89_9TREE|nr:hypothetical protein QFC20_007502 [Naganishia adeliensis]
MTKHKNNKAKGKEKDKAPIKKGGKGNDSNDGDGGTDSDFGEGNERGTGGEFDKPTIPTKAYRTRSKITKGSEQNEGGKEEERGDAGEKVAEAEGQPYDFLGMPPEPIIGITAQDLWITRTTRQTLPPNDNDDRFTWNRRHSADQYLATQPWIATDEREIALFRAYGCSRCRGRWPCGKEGQPCPKCVEDQVPSGLCVGYVPANFKRADDVSEDMGSDSVNDERDQEELMSDEEDSDMGENMGEGFGD